MMPNTHHSITTRSLTHFVRVDKMSDGEDKQNASVHLLPLTGSDTMSTPSTEYSHSQRRRVNGKASGGGGRNTGSSFVVMTVISIVVGLLVLMNHHRQKDVLVFGNPKLSKSPSSPPASPPISSFLRGYSSSSLLSIEQLTAHLMAYTETANKQGGLGLSFSDSLSSLEQLTAHFMVYISNTNIDGGLLSSSSLLGEDGTHLYHSEHHYDDFEDEYFL